MKNKMLQRMLSLFLVVCMIAAWALPTAASAAGISFRKVSNDRISANLFDRDTAGSNSDEPTYADDEIVRVSIVLEQAGTLDAGFDPENIAQNEQAMAYRENLQKNQDSIVRKIQKVIGQELDVVWNVTLAANVISANVQYGMIDSIQRISGVKKVSIETKYIVETNDATADGPNMATSGSQTGSSAAYAAGLTGAGSRIAIIDSGLDVEHLSFDPGAFLYSLSLMAQQKGMDPDTYMESLDLLDAEEIAAVMPYLNIAQELEALGLSAEDLMVNAKVAFGFNYIDSDTNLSHLYDTGSEHGSHVAGIAAANAYVPNDDGGYDNALQTVKTQGVAPDAQLMVMKVFGVNGGAYDSDYMVAIEDAVMLGADSINLSLGSSSAGMATARTQEFEQILENLERSGVVVSISAGNNGSWADNTYNGYLYLDDVNLQTGGSPGSFKNSLGVASIENVGTTGDYLIANGGYLIPFYESSYSNAPIGTIAGDYEYVFLNGVGKAEEFAALMTAMGVESLEGKIVVCLRGEITFAEKANNAVACGATAVVIMNTENLLINMNLEGYTGTAPVVSVPGYTKSAFTTNPITGADDTTIGWTGIITVNPGPISVGVVGGGAMSSFSSWGVPGNLTMKPEITAPGGNIYSVGGAYQEENGQYFFMDHQSYETMSGTSMAAPQVAGMAAILAQYIREAGLEERTGLDARTLSQSLLMSTAVPIMDEENGGSYYPVLQQGAGLANVGNAIMADSFILMGADATASYADGKVKAELGDDPMRTGVYTFSFTINNLTDEEKVYALSSDFFTQSAFSYDGDLYMDFTTTALDHYAFWTVNGNPVEGGAEMAAMDFNGDGYVTSADGQRLLDYAAGLDVQLSNAEAADLNQDGKINSYDAYLFFKMLGENGVVVPADGSAQIEVTITLTDETKEYLEYYENGAYIQGYVYAESLTSDEGVEGTSHSIPVLAFYGNWSDASMFDKGSYEDYILTGEESRMPYLTEETLMYGMVNGFFITDVNDPTYEMYLGGNLFDGDEPYMPERNAISSFGFEISSVGFSAIRNCGLMLFYLADVESGEFLALQQVTTQYAAAYVNNSGVWKNTYTTLNLGFTGQLEDNTRVEAGVMLIPEYYIGADGSIDWAGLGKGVTFSMEMTVDHTAPTLNGINLDVLNDELVLNITDNQYVAQVFLMDQLGMTVYAVAGSNPDAQPGEALDYTIDMTGVNGAGFLLAVADYAGNMTTYELDMPHGTLANAADSIEIMPESLLMQKGTTAELLAVVNPLNAMDRTVTWSSDDEAIVTVDENGNVLAVGVGTTIITATSNLSPDITASCEVEVIDIAVDLNAIIWDEVGAIHFSEFNTGSLPDYTKLSSNVLDMDDGDYLVSAVVGPQDILFASSLNTSTGTGSLYMIDPETYEPYYYAPCQVGSSSIFYSDLAYAENMFGLENGMLLASYGPYLIIVNPANGSALGIISQFDNDIVGIATGDAFPLGSGLYANEVFVIENNGTVTYDIYISNAQFQYATYSQMTGEEPDTIDTGINKGSAWYFNSAYYDGQYLFWSAFDEDTENVVTLYAIDIFGTGAVYELGQFADGVWPVGGLYQAPGTGEDEEPDAVGSIDINPEMFNGRTPSLELLEKVEVKASAPQSKGEIARPFSSAIVGAAEQSVTVNVTAKDADGVDIDSTNGLITVEFDPSALTLRNVVVNSDYSSVRTDSYNGKVTIAYVSLDAIEAGETVATLVFDVVDTSVEQVKVIHKEVNDTEPGTEEYVAINYTHANTELRGYVPETCTTDGYSGDLYCTDCGRLIRAGEVVPATGHSYGEWYETVAAGCETPGEEKRECANCDHAETRETDPTGHSYGEWYETVAPGCETAGEEKRDCANCDHFETRETEATGHSYVDVVTPPTVDAEGYTTHTCEHCGHSYVDSYTERVPVVPPTGESLVTRLCITALVISVSAMAVLMVYRKKFAQNG